MTISFKRPTLIGCLVLSACLKQGFAQENTLTSMVNIRVNNSQKLALGLGLQINEIVFQLSPGWEGHKVSIGYGGATDESIYKIFRPMGGGAKISFLSESVGHKRDLVGLELGLCYGLCLELGYFEDTSNDSDSLVLISTGFGY